MVCNLRVRFRRAVMRVGEDQEEAATTEEEQEATATTEKAAEEAAGKYAFCCAVLVPD